MSNDTLATMQSELSKLRAEKTRIDSAIDEIESALKVFAKYSPNVNVEATNEPSILDALPARRNVLMRRPTKQDQIFKGVLDILSDGFARPTDYILKELTARKIEVGGENPEANLSAYLSRAKDDLGLNADRRAGWSLKK